MSHANPVWNWQSSYPAPAKLNLFLHVVGRRVDGYHLLQTVFRLIEPGDSLRFSPRSDGRVGLTTPLPGVRADDDLSVRAARLLQAEAAALSRRSDLGVDISLHKRLPLGGGLGGGSSDAATVLLALNHLWQLGLRRERLQEIGLRLGADVPVFIFGRNAFAQGVGEALHALDLPERYYLVVQPAVNVSTGAIFAAPELRRDTPTIGVDEWSAGFGGNDLQSVACARFPQIAACLDWLSRFAEARMTGSGACVFAEFAERVLAEEICRRVPPDWRAWVAAGLARHPLHALAGDI